MALVPPVAVRWLHLFAVATLLGGAALTWAVVRQPGDSATTTSLAATYEWLFWLAVGLVALTGVGNLGAMAPAVPTEGSWARTLTVKLGLLLAFLLGSVWRTLVVIRLRGADSSATDPRGVLRWSYAGTTLVLAILVALAAVMAHG